MFLKVMLTKYCTVEQNKRQGLKTHVNNNKKRARGKPKHQKPLKTHVNNSKNEATSRPETPEHPDTRTRESQR